MQIAVTTVASATLGPQETLGPKAYPHNVREQSV